MITPDNRKVPLIRDDIINFTWLAERPRARPTILMQQQVAQEYDRDPESKVRRPVKIPVLENIDPTPVRPDNKENIDTILDARTNLPSLNFGGAGMHSNAEVEGERRKSPRLAAKQNDTSPAMKKDNENSKLQKIGVRFQTESQPGKSQSGTGKWHVIDKIIEHRDIDGQREYKVRWKGYSANEDQWKEAKDIRDEIREEYEKSIKIEKTIGPCTLRIDCRCKECSKFTNEADTFLQQVPCDNRPACKCTACLRFYDEDGTWNEAKASIQVSSGVKREPHTVGKQHNTPGELGPKTTSDESDQTVFDDYKKRQMQMTGKQIRIKLPAMRMLDTGEPADVQKLKTYVHELFGHLGCDTIFDACEMIGKDHKTDKRG
jgi:hypothetical protein